MTIRPITRNDLPGLCKIIDGSDLFPSEMLADMTASFLNAQDCDEIWLTQVDDETPVSLVYCTPEKMTEGTYNALLLAVLKERQGSGHGSTLMKHLEGVLRNERKARLLLVETSGTDEYARTRAFYEKLGFEKEACIREFYQAGEDKIIYRKKL